MSVKSVNIGQRIQASRKAAGLTQAALAARFNVTAAAVSQWEVGAAAPSVELIPQLCEELGISPDWLFSVNELQPDSASKNQLQRKELALVNRLSHALASKQLSAAQLTIFGGLLEQFVPNTRTSNPISPNH